MLRIFLITSLLLTACGNVGGINLAQYSDPVATPQNFFVCHGYGCSQKTQSGFTDLQWSNIQKIFKQKSENAVNERKKIASAIALMEKYMGETIGTNNDLPKAPIIRSSDKELDCIDETVNTTKYLTFLKQDDLLQWHSVGQPVYKGFIINGVYPHNSATIVENQTGQVYVVDSYIYKNGVKPDIRPLESWLEYRIEELDRTELQKAENLNQVNLESLTP